MGGSPATISLKCIYKEYAMQGSDLLLSYLTRKVIYFLQTLRHIPICCGVYCNYRELFDK